MKPYIALLACISLFATTEASHGDPSHYLCSIHNGEATITGYRGPGGNVIIPSELEGAPVTIIGDDAFWGVDSVTSVSIPDSVFSIGQGAFLECSFLTNVTIGNSVTSIGEFAFAFCSSLIGVTFGNSVTSIGKMAFGGCSSLDNVIITDSVTSIGEGAFLDCTSLTSVIIPDSVTSIGEGAFQNCASLTSVTIPDSVVSIGKGAFRACTSLASVTIGNGVTHIGRRAFESCTSLTSVIIPDSVTSIGEGAFLDCNSLAEVTLPPRFISQLGSILPSELVELVSFTMVDMVARMIREQPGNYGLATKADLTNVVASTIESIQSSPQEYGLFSESDYQANFESGQQSVLSNPSAFDLYDETSIMDLNYGGLMLREENGAMLFEFALEEATDLIAGDWRIVDRISYEVEPSSAQAFLRVRADHPDVEPTVTVLDHPDHGEILTDMHGMALYFLQLDTPGGHSLYSGSTWPYVEAVNPVPDLGVEAVLGTSDYGLGSGPYLTINERPVYYYHADSPGEAAGHGSGGVWWTIQPDGMMKN